jgi:2-iminobutanoate/2-iminopropanoate deaminase
MSRLLADFWRTVNNHTITAAGVCPGTGALRFSNPRHHLSLTGARKAVRPCTAFMSKKTIVKPPKSPAAVGPYNHGVRVGSLLFCSGQIPIDPATGNLVSGDIKAQTERVLQNIKVILDDQKLTFASVVKTTVFMTNLADFAGMNEVYAKFFAQDAPARSTVQVAALPKGANVEIEVIAHF